MEARKSENQSPSVEPSDGLSTESLDGEMAPVGLLYAAAEAQLTNDKAAVREFLVGLNKRCRALARKYLNLSWEQQRHNQEFLKLARVKGLVADEFGKSMMRASTSDSPSPTTPSTTSETPSPPSGETSSDLTPEDMEPSL